MSSNEERACALAATFRAEHDLGDLPAKDMFELVHSAAGVDVVSMEASEAEHGLSMMDPATGRVVVAVATTGNPMRQRSSIAHELGHVLAGDLERAESLTPGERSPEEIRADAFARHLLLPLSALRRRYSAGTFTLARLSEVAQEFEVSPALASIQLRTVGRIDADVCREWSALSARSLAARFGWLSQYESLAADSRRPRAPQTLMSRAVDGYWAGALGITELANWYGLDADDLVDQLGGDPEDAPDTHAEESGDGWDDYWDDDRPLFPDDTQGGPQGGGVEGASDGPARPVDDAGTAS